MQRQEFSVCAPWRRLASGLVEAIVTDRIGPAVICLFSAAVAVLVASLLLR